MVQQAQFSHFSHFETEDGSNAGHGISSLVVEFDSIL
jgi:hypothetical protein